MTCWFWNIDRPSREFFAKELEAGRLRQGWGYDPRLDLRKLREKRERGEDLTQKEEAAWERCRPMLDSVEEGDYVAVKNVPSTDKFTLVEVTGDYDFDLKDIGDFGHYLPVRVIQSFHKQGAAVPAPLVNALNRERHPIRRTKKHRDRVVKLAEQSYSEEEALEPEPETQTIESWQRALWPALRDRLQETLDSRLAERLVLSMLEQGGLDVVYNAGPSEKGADILAEVDIGYGLSTDLAVQVKMRWGVDNRTNGVDQLIEAFEEYDADMGLLVTFADSLGPDLEEALEEAKREYRIEALWGEELYAGIAETLTNSDYEVELEERA